MSLFSIRSAADVPDSQIYEAFEGSFADYIVPMSMTEQQFLGHMFGPAEANERRLSLVAYDQAGRPVALMLGGFHRGELEKTLRCGGMGLIPDVRGSGLAGRLYAEHRKLAAAEGCSRLFLEVIKNNDRAVRFYEKMGYSRVYELTYCLWEINQLTRAWLSGASASCQVKAVGVDEILDLRGRDRTHIPWQGSPEYLRFDDACSHYAVSKDGEIIAGLSMTANKLHYMWVDPAFRRQGFMKKLLAKGVADLKPEKLAFSFANNADLHLFARHLGMRFRDLKQYEMYQSV